MRNANNKVSVSNLLQIPPSSTGKLSILSTSDIGDESLYGRYDQLILDCDAAILIATPLSLKLSGRAFDGVRDMLNPGFEGMQEILDSILKYPSI